ncbi:MAG: hypothetical protein MZU97_17505 [Bacillus subtilis]|nr:hypothetical protein [Bacillus subtilis]
MTFYLGADPTADQSSRRPSARIPGREAADATRATSRFSSSAAAPV